MLILYADSMREIGLTTGKAAQLLKEYGLNQLPEHGTQSWVTLLLAQFKNIMSVLLGVAAVLSLVVGDTVDVILVLLILVLNAGLGFWQEFKASKELEALRKLEVALTRVIRDGRQQQIQATQLVPGDVIILESGDKIPADATVIDSIDLMVNEAALTGESLPVEKLDKDFTANTLFFGTTVASGRGTAKVFATGINTRFGKIAITLSSVVEEKTPLEIVLDGLGKKIGILAIGVAMLLFVVRTIQGVELFEVFFGSVALMVAAVPEGLPAIITIALAFGVHRMYSKKTLVRRMSAVESLGGATVICTDKTGTLTLNEMRVKEVLNEPGLDKVLLMSAVFCNSASLVLKEGKNGDSFDVLGDSTEGALLLWAKDMGIDIDLEREKAKLLHEIPFDLKRRMMTTVWQQNDKVTIYSKGAPEMILPLCRLSEHEARKHSQKYQDLAAKGLRVLAFAANDVPHKLLKDKTQSLEKNLQFLGFIGIADKSRPNVKEAILKAKNAGIKVVMVTGDNELTAKAIGEEVGLLEAGDEVLTGMQLDELDEEQLIAKLDKVRIFARVIPEHKLRIVKAFQKRGDVVAVTGDGVNDSLALKQAEVGIAMGITGTDVAKESADLIILDDNFATIVTAIEEGRLIYHNIIKVVKFLLAGNLSEVLVIVLAALLGLPTPFLPVQILWINFVTDGLPALALVVDPSFKGIMTSKPQKHADSLLSFSNLSVIAVCGGLVTIGVFVAFWYGFNSANLSLARAYAFSAIVILQMVMVYAMRARQGMFSNKYLNLAVAMVLLIQALIMFYPPLQSIFKIV